MALEPIKNIRIRARLIVVFALMVVVLATVATTGIMGIDQTSAGLTTLYQDALVPANQLSRINNLMEEIVQQLIVASVSQSSPENVHKYIARVNADSEEIDSLISQYLKGDIPADQQDLAEIWQKKRQAFIDEAQKPTITALQSAAAGGSFDEAEDIITGLGIQLNGEAQNAMDALMAQQLVAAKVTNQTAQAQVSVMRVVEYAGIAIGLFLCFLVLFVIRSLSQLMQDMEVLHTTTAAMLNSLGQGLIFFDGQGICSKVFSKACLTLLESNPADQHIADVLNLTPENHELLDTSLRLLYTGKFALGFDEWAVLAPSSYAHSGGLTISLTYRPIMGADGKLKSILLAANDRTEEKKVENIMKMNEVAALRTLRIARNRNHFIRFVENFKACIDVTSAADDVTSAEQLRRDIHTLKGTADTFQLAGLVHKLHSLENDLQEDVPDPQAVILEHRPTLMKTLENNMVLAREILGEDFQSSGEVRTIPEKQLYAFAKDLQTALESGKPAQEICQSYLQELVAIPVWSFMDDFAMTLQELGDRFGKPFNPCVFSGENFSVLPKIYKHLFASFVHIARNTVDHGVEDPSVRDERMKDPKAQVIVRTQISRKQDNDWILIEFIDDGGGIDVPLLRRKLIEKLNRLDLEQADDHTIMQYIFDSTVSTKQQATQLSGRGIGMSALKTEAMNLGGNVEVLSRYGYGVTIKVEVPFHTTLAAVH